MAMASKRSKRKGSGNNSKKSNKGNWNNGNANDTSPGSSNSSSTSSRGSGSGSSIVDRRLPGKNSLISSCFLSKVFIFLRVAATAAAAKAAAATATYNSSSSSSGSKSKQRTKQHTESVAIFFRVASHPYLPSPLLARSLPKRTTIKSRKYLNIFLLVLHEATAMLTLQLAATPAAATIFTLIVRFCFVFCLRRRHRRRRCRRRVVLLL